jgi:pimeloyl-ACP methyl ester carboxylesterase
LRRGTQAVAIEPQVFDLLIYLVQNRERVVSKDDLIASVWGGRIVSESTLASRINAARRAIGDNGKDQRLIKTSARKGIRYIGEVREELNESLPATSGPGKKAAGPQQDIHFCTTSDNVRIAYAETGHGPPLVKAATWLNHLEYDFESPIWRPILHRLSAKRKLIRYDQRGNGLSDWAVDISFEAFVEDLETVIDATGLDRFPLLGMSQGSAVSVAYAVRHPERVTHLILYGGYCQGMLSRNDPDGPAQADALATLMLQGWWQENPAFRQIFTSQFIPGGTIEQVQWFNDLQKVTTSPENAVRIFNTMANIDVSELLPFVRVPTLVLHCRDDARVPFEEGRRVAAAIPGARFVPLEGRNHVMLESDVSWNRLFDEIERFIER